MTQRLIHVLVAIVAVQEHGRVLVREQKPEEPVAGHFALGDVGLVRLVLGDDLLGPVLVKVREQDLVQTRVPLFLVEELQQPLSGQVLLLARPESPGIDPEESRLTKSNSQSHKQLLHICPGTNLVVQAQELLEGEQCRLQIFSLLMRGEQ